MPPKITRVRWSAQNVPWGISFNEKNGTFSGAPEDVGEYTVPVTVETNYGKDTKDVKIIVTPPVYSVYAIGAKAAAWSGNADPDEDGFYGLSMPKAYELKAHYQGFGALTEGQKYYCCGYYGVQSGRYGFGSIEEMILSNNKQPLCLNDKYDNVRRILCGKVNASFRENNTTYTDKYYFIFSLFPPSSSEILNTKKVECFDFDMHFGSGIQTPPHPTDGTVYITGYIGGVFTLNQILSNSEKLLLSNMYMFSDKVYLNGNSISFLSSYGTHKVILTPQKSSAVRAYATIRPPNIRIVDLGYRAIKFLDAHFDCLSETGYLDNNPDNFTHGIIKDAWAYGNVVYVQTTNNQLYEYVSSSSTWNLLGTYDVKKVEIPSGAMTFFLTNNGELYHKGNAVSGVTEAHDNFTHIFTNLNFADFTFGGNTLTVLRE